MFPEVVAPVPSHAIYQTKHTSLLVHDSKGNQEPSMYSQEKGYLTFDTICEGLYK